MKFRVETSALKDALKKAKLTVSPNDTNVLLQNFAMRVDGDKLTIIATDLQLATICEVDADVDVEGATTLPGTKFLDMVNASSADQVEVEADTGGQHAYVRSGSYQAKLMTLPYEDFPRVEDFNDDAAKSSLREIMLEKLNRISFSVADNEAKKNLLAVYINDGYMQASDGRVTTVVEFDKEFQDILIPALAVKDLVRVLRVSEAKDVSICSTDSFLLFKIGNDVFMTRLSSAKFPNIPKKIIGPTEKNSIIFKSDRAKLRAAINRIGVTTSDKNLAIKMEVRPDSCGAGATLVLSSNDAVGNSAEEELEIEYLGEALKVYFDYTRLLDILDALTEPDVEIKMHTNRKVPVRIEEKDPIFMSFLMRLAEQIMVPTRATDAEGVEKVDEL